MARKRRRQPTRTWKPRPSASRIDPDQIWPDKPRPAIPPPPIKLPEPREDDEPRVWRPLIF